ncbi:MAG: hypothetical protein CSB49_03855 [Proteobacteria bacterium]|nr:MAG: hypothetical protein CSB49_03855 [Pseudomonadota bacterium]
MSGHPAPPMAPRDPLIGVELDNYRVEAKMAEGGMGLIYRAVHNTIGRQAAIKVLSHRYSDDQNMIKRLHREAVAVNRIGHPNIVDIFGFGRTPDNREYFIMEFLEGESLAEVILRQGALPWSFTSQVMAQCLDALAAAHDLDIIHRDIKPENILVLRDGDQITAKVLDFGIAKSIGVGEGSEQLTSAGSVMGTPEYIAPEQIRGKEVDGRADLYAMGLILYELVSGKQPYTSDTVMSLLMSHLRDPIPSAPVPAPQLEIPESVLEIIPKAMAKEPSQRFQDARSFAAALGLDSRAGSPADGTRPLPDSFWEADGLRSTGEISWRGTAPHGVLTAGTGPVDRQAPTEAQLPTQPERKRSPLVWLAPLALIVLSAAAIAFIALKPKNGATKDATKDGSGSFATALVKTSGEGSGAGVGATKAVRFAPVNDLKDLVFRVRRTLNKGLDSSDTSIRQRALIGVGDLKDQNVREKLIDVLKTDPELAPRATAAKALSQLGDQSVAAPLKAARRTQEPSVRVAIDDALQRLHDPAGRKGLRKALTSKQQGIRVAAALALGESGDGSKRVRKVLEGLLASGNAKLTPPLLSALARSGHEKALSTLREGAKKGDARTKLTYAEALAKLGDEDAAKALRAIVKAKTELPTRLVAAKGLASLGDYTGLGVLKRGVTHRSAQVRRLAADALGSVSDRSALPPLAHTLKDKEQGVRVTGAASLARILSLMPDQLLVSGQNWLLAALSQGDWSARYAAVGLTAEMDPDLAVELLGWALKDKDERVRAAAVRRLAQLARNSAKARTYVRARLFYDRSPAVRAAAAEGVGSSGASDAKRLLLAAVSGDKSRSVVGIAAAGQLLAMGDTRGLKGLLRATKAKSAGTRARAYHALTRWQQPDRRRQLLRRGLKDKSGEVRLASALVLARLGDKDARTLKVLEEAVTDKGSQPALEALSALGVSQATRVKLLASAKPATRRRMAMSSAVSALGATHAVPLLRRGVRDDNVGVRRAAAQGLASIAAAQPTAVAPLLNKLAHDPDATVRAAAAVGLAKLPRKLAGKPPAPTAKVAPVKLAPAPTEPKLPKKPKAAKTDKPVTLELSFVEDNRREASYKELIVRAELQLRRGRYLAALRTLSQARRVGKKRPAALFETARVLMKLAIQAKRQGDKRKARGYAKSARRYYQKVRRGNLTAKARGGERDAARLLKALR